jgi:hypothetical protein
MAGLSYDNEVPEIYLGGFIANGLHRDKYDKIHVEKYYISIAKDLNIPIDDALIKTFGGQRADIAVYRNDMPPAIVELKIFDEAQNASKIVADRDKMKRFADLKPIEGYLGILVTDAKNGQRCAERIETLERALGQKFDEVGKMQRSVDEKWDWCFASLKMEAHKTRLTMR